MFYIIKPSYGLKFIFDSIRREIRTLCSELRERLFQLVQIMVFYLRQRLRWEVSTTYLVALKQKYKSLELIHIYKLHFLHEKNEVGHEAD